MPFINKGAEEFSKEFGKKAADKAQELLTTLKVRLSGKKETEEGFERFQNDPENNKTLFEEILLKELQNNKALAAELDEFIKQLKRTGPKIDAHMRKVEGEELTVIKAKMVRRGEINASMEDVKTKKGVVAEFDDIG